MLVTLMPLAAQSGAAAALTTPTVAAHGTAMTPAIANRTARRMDRTGGTSTLGDPTCQAFVAPGRMESTHPYRLTARRHDGHLVSFTKAIRRIARRAIGLVQRRRGGRECDIADCGRSAECFKEFDHRCPPC